MARYAGRHVVGVDAAEVLRDRLTRECLAIAATGDERRNVEVLGFDPRWWDGQAHDACLVVRIAGRPARVIESAGEAVVVPFTRTGAVRALANRRGLPAIDLTMPTPRDESDRVIDVRDDFIHCDGDDCGALLPIEFVGECARCGSAKSQI